MTIFCAYCSEPATDEQHGVGLCPRHAAAVLQCKPEAVIRQIPQHGDGEGTVDANPPATLYTGKDK